MQPDILGIGNQNSWRHLITQKTDNTLH